MAQPTPDVRLDVEQARARSHVAPDPHELASLVQHLAEGETVERLTRCQYVNAPGLLVLTDRRLLVVVDTRFTRRFQEWNLAELSSIQWHAGRVHGTVHVFTGGRVEDITGVDVRDGRDLVDTARERLPQRH